MRDTVAGPAAATAKLRELLPVLPRRYTNHVISARELRHSRPSGGPTMLSGHRLLLVAAGIALLPSPSLSCKVFSNTDFNGHDLSTAHSSNFEGCCSLCDATHGCSFWTFMPPQTCYLKTSSAGHRPSPKGGAQSYTSGCKNASCVLPPPAPPPPSASSYGCDPHGGERGVCVNGGVGNFPNASCGSGTPQRLTQRCRPYKHAVNIL